MNELALFAGAGGGILGGKLLGWKTVCAVESEPHAAIILAKRQNEGFLPAFPIWDDVQTFDGIRWRGIVDVVSGGFPCQDISIAGKGAGIDGDQSGLWGEMARIIRDVRPRFAFVENTPALTIRGFGRVLGDLAAMGFNVRWCVLGADDTGMVHHRKRIWICAYTDENKHTLPGENRRRKFAQQSSGMDLRKREERRAQNFRNFESRTDRIIDGVAFGVDRLQRIGIGQVPGVAKLAWNTLTKERTK